MIYVHCPVCQKTVPAFDDQIGTVVTCSRCGNPVVAPVSAPGSSSPGVVTAKPSDVAADPSRIIDVLPVDEERITVLGMEEQRAHLRPSVLDCHSDAPLDGGGLAFRRAKRSVAVVVFVIALSLLVRHVRRSAR